MPAADRHHRQTLLPGVGTGGQRRLANSAALVVGCGALGGTVLEQLCRAGVGRVVLADRDVVEPTNLQRQTLFADADLGRAKSDAAAERLRAIDSAVTLEPHATDVHSGNVADLADGCGVLVDATDNAATRYLLNDLAVKTATPFVYGGCVGTEGRALAVTAAGPCLRCVFRDPPGPGEAATCDTSGVLGPAAAVAAAWQAGLALQLLLGHTPPPRLLTFDVWRGVARTIEAEKNPSCPCCGAGEFPFLDAPPGDATTLCGRDTVQLRLGGRLDLPTLADRLRPLGEVRQLGPLLRFTPADGPATLSLFPDGRVLVQGAKDAATARSLAARYVGV